MCTLWRQTQFFYIYSHIGFFSCNEMNDLRIPFVRCVSSIDLYVYPVSKVFCKYLTKKIILHKHSHIHVHERRSSSFSSERFFGFNGNLLVSVYKRWTSRTKMWFSLLLVSSSFKQRLFFTCYFLQLIHSVQVGSLNSPQRKIACGSWSLLHISIFCMHKKTENVK